VGVRARNLVPCAPADYGEPGIPKPLDALCNNLAACFSRKPNERRRQRPSVLIAVYVLDKAAVELDNVWLEFQDMAKTRKACTGVIDGHS